MSWNKTLPHEIYQVSQVVGHISSPATRHVFLVQTGDVKHIQRMAA